VHGSIHRYHYLLSLSCFNLLCVLLLDIKLVFHEEGIALQQNKFALGLFNRLFRPFANFEVWVLAQDKGNDVFQLKLSKNFFYLPSRRVLAASLTFLARPSLCTRSLCFFCQLNRLCHLSFVRSCRSRLKYQATSFPPFALKFRLQDQQYRTQP